ncbi:calcium-activated chloride channel-domain-containing protein [Zopfochytrium polystomum]|nr:calcium-activated chloride channel-domain-containing protein [Zopfochytrium polystomum]
MLPPGTTTTTRTTTRTTTSTFSTSPPSNSASASSGLAAPGESSSSSTSHSSFLDSLPIFSQDSAADLSLSDPSQSFLSSAHSSTQDTPGSVSIAVDPVADADENQSHQLEIEAFGENKELLDFEDDDILSRHYTGRCVHFLYPEDLALFDEIVAFKKSNPSTPFELAVERFCSRSSGDALTKIAYADEYTHWDAILKFDLKSSKSETEGMRRRARAHFERELLRNHLFLVRERGADAESVALGQEDLGCHFIKVMGSFGALAIEAERLKLQMDVTQRVLRVHKRIQQRIQNDHSFRPSQASVRYLNSTLNSADSSDPIALQGVQELAVRGVKVEKMPSVPLEEFSEGHDGTLKGLLMYAFAYLPNPIDLDKEPFLLKDLHHYKGGDARAEGSSVGKVQLNFFSNATRNLIVRSVINRARVHGFKPSPVGITTLLYDGVYQDFYTVHDGLYCDEDKADARNVPLDNMRSWLYVHWATARFQVKKILAEQPLRQIRDYFGEKIAFYFSFLGFYTVWLLFPGLFGLAVFLYGVFGTSSQTNETVFDNAATPWFALFMSVWANVFLEFWKRYNSTLQAVWDVRLLHIVEQRRPEWYGTVLRRDPITGKVEPHFPFWSKVFLRCLTTLALLSLIGFMVAFEALVVLVHAYTKGTSIYVSSAISGVLSLLNVLFLTPVYLNLAAKLNAIENHKTQQSFEDNYVQKTFLFNFVNNYSTLLYVGILKVFLGGALPRIGLPVDECAEDTPCMDQLMLNMAITFAGLAFVFQAQAVLLPMVTQYFKSTESKRKYLELSRSKNAAIPQYILDDTLDDWDQQREVNRSVVQFGFVTLFSCAFPLAPLLAFASNSLEIRFGAYRLLTQCQRPFVSRSKGLGAWFEIMIIMARVGAIVNGLIIAFTSAYVNKKLFHEFEGETKVVAQILYVVIFEHVVIGLAVLLDRLIPDMPTNLRYSLAREEFLARIETGEEIAELLDQARIENADPKQSLARVWSTKKTS